jgi:cell division protein FtsN
MRFLIYLVIGLVLVSASCAGTNKRLRKSRKPANEQVIPKVEEKKTSDEVIPIKEVEEKLVPIAEVMPNPHRYFVIIGSFRNPENAKKHQGQILTEGFSSEILKNEEGLYRVSVLATDEINVAREDIRRIRNIFPKYFDTWLLIQKK